MRLGPAAFVLVLVGCPANAKRASDTGEDSGATVDTGDTACAPREWFYDQDADTFGDPDQMVASCDAPVGYVLVSGDCADEDALVHPDAVETCNDVDDDCNGEVDDGAADAADWYPDADGDEYGADAADPVAACTQPAGFVADATDCDDTAYLVHPGAVEYCGGDDRDCDGDPDDPDSADALTLYLDADGDTFGDPAAPTTGCDVGAGYSSNDNDCDDSAADVHPGADEHCNGTDDDCDSAIDDSAVDVLTWNFDADGDGFGTPTRTTTGCEAPPYYVASGDDCVDTDSSIYPGAPDGCDGVDHDCDGVVDEDDSFDAPTWAADADGDGYGDPGDLALSCAAPSGRVADAQDCDDTTSAVNPGVTETCDGVDQDCDGVVDDDPADALTWFTDADGDGYGEDATAASGCTAAVGSVAVGGDCDDADATRSPAAAEVCGDAVDEDCDGLAPECFAGAIASADADLELDAPVGDEHFGTALAAADVDGDGHADLLVGGSKAVGSKQQAPVWVLAGPITAATTASVAPDYTDLGGLSAGGDPGFITDRDLDGDGTADLVIANYEKYTYGSSTVCLVSLPAADLSSCDTTLTYRTYYVGVEGLGAGDINGDGSVEVLAHAYQDDAIAYDFSGTKVATIHNPSSGYWNGPVETSGDLFGTGMDSVVLGRATSAAPLEVYLFDGVPSGSGVVVDADTDAVAVIADTSTEVPNLKIVPDTDGDGLADLVLYKMYSSTSYLFTGVGSLTTSSAFGDATSTLSSSVSTWAGYHVAAVDVDADGAEDLLFSSSSNTAYLVYGPQTGTIDLDACADCATISVAATGGSSVAPFALGDLFESGYQTLGVANGYARVGGGEDGIAWLFDAG